MCRQVQIMENIKHSMIFYLQLSLSLKILKQSNVNIVKNDFNVLLQPENMNPDNTQYYSDDFQSNVELGSNNIVDNSLDLNLFENNMVVCNENLQNDSLADVEFFEFNEVNCIVEKNEENVLNYEKRHSIIPQPDKWKRKTTKRLKMNGEEYIGYQRKKSVVSHNVLRLLRNIQPTCVFVL